MSIQIDTEPVALHTDLADHVEHLDGMTVIRHPLLYSVPHFDQFNGIVNRQYEAKMDAALTAMNEEDWVGYVWLHERPYRADIVATLAGSLGDDLASVVAEVWIDSENIRERRHIWDRIWHHVTRLPAAARNHLMQPDEHAGYDALGERIEVFQGHTDIADDGWSWTTDRAVAEWFAQRFARFENACPIVTVGTVDRADVLAYWTRRGEAEVVAARTAVKVTASTRLGA